MTTDRPWDDSVDVAPDPQLVSVAHACFDFARAGDTERLRAYVEQGVPVNLTDATGNTLLKLASFHGQSPLSGAICTGKDDVVRVLLAAGADPEVGTPSARATAEMFDRADLLTPEV